MRKTYEKYENEEDLNFGKQKNYPSRRKSTFQAARTAKHTKAYKINLDEIA